MVNMPKGSQVLAEHTLETLVFAVYIKREPSSLWEQSALGDESVLWDQKNQAGICVFSRFDPQISSPNHM